MAHPGLLNDIMFKIVFGTQQSVPTLRALINALLDLQGPQKIVSLEILNPVSEKAYLTQKGPILDVKARDENGSQYNVEIQLRAGASDFTKRSLYYTTKFYCDQLQKGQPYDILAKTISISILDFNLFPASVELHSKFQLWEREQGFLLSEDLELHYIELRKFSASKPHQLRTRFEKWLYLLKFADIYATDQELPDNLSQEEGITMAIDSMRKAYARDEIRELIEAREKAERDEISRLYHAEQKGLKQGRERGLEQGRKKERLEIAKRLLASGLTRDQVRQATDLTDEEVAHLR